MMICLEYHKTELSLFSRVDDVLKCNGLYKISKEKEFALEYWYDDNAYTVKGRRHNKPFVLRLGSIHCGRAIVLDRGTTLILEKTSMDRTWFYCPALLIGKQSQWITEGLGYTTYGSLESMLMAGSISKITK